MQDVRNLADLVRSAAARDGGLRPALYWHDRRLTWAQLDAQVDAVAAALSRLIAADRDAPGVPPRVAIALPNVPEFAAAYFGALRAGLVAVPVNPGFTGRELRQILSDCGATVLIGTPSVLDMVSAEPGALGTGPDSPGGPAPLPLRYSYVFGEPTTEPDQWTASPSHDAPPWRRPFSWLMPDNAGEAPRFEATTGGEDIALLLYTSGTSGAPKGAMLSHRAMIANQAQLAAIDPPPMGPDDVVLLTLPLFHSYGLGPGLGAVAYHGASGVLVERFDPADTLAQIVRHRVTTVIGVPPMYVAWSLMGDQLRRAFSWVRVAVSGAAPLDPATAQRFIEVTGQPIYEGYGLTETAPVLTSTMGQHAPKLGSIGRPLPQVKVRLVDASGEDVDLEINDDDREHADDDLEHDAPATPGTDPGEIVARGPNLFSGYWPDGRGGPDGDGWWATGDVAYADGDGDLFLVDRLGELIIVSGFNVYPREVELVLATHASVLEAAAVAAPHPYTGQTVRAYVVLAPDAAVTAEELIAYCERMLARFKCPTAVEFVPQLPRTATGKVRKSELERIYG